VKTAFGYIRVSRDREKEKLSPQVQRRRIKDYCNLKRWTLLETFEDIDIPGGDFDRPGWNKLTQRLDEVDVIVATEFTRIGRSMRETVNRIEDLHSLGKDVVAIDDDIDTTTASGKMMFHVILALSQFERDRMSERLRATHYQIAREGRWKGGRPPLGYDYVPGDGQLTVNEREAEIVAEIYAYRDNGWSIRSIVKELYRYGIHGKYGTMNYTSVRKTLSNPAYIGKRNHKGEILPAGHEPIIPDKLWERVQARNRNAKRIDRKYLLSGFLKCGDCGGPMVHQSQGVGKRQYYACKNATEFGRGKRVTVEEHVIDSLVMERFFARIDPARFAAAEKRIRARIPKQKSRQGEIQASLEKTEAALNRLISDYYDSDIPPITLGQFRDRNAKLQKRRDGLLSEAENIKDLTTLDVQPPKDLREKWDLLNLDERRESLRLVIERVIVYPRPPGKKINPARVKVFWK